MSILVYVIGGLLAIIVFFLIVAIFVPKDFSVVKQVVIQKPKSKVFEYVKYLKNQDSYSKWGRIDPAMVKTFRGVDSTVGFVSRWESKDKNVGIGEQEISKITPDRIDYQIRFEKPWKSVSPSWMAFDAKSETSCQVEWGFEGTMNYPMNLMLLFKNMEKTPGNDLQTGLNDLKKILEK